MLGMEPVPDLRNLTIALTQQLQGGIHISHTLHLQQELTGSLTKVCQGYPLLFQQLTVDVQLVVCAGLDITPLTPYLSD